MNKLYIQLYSVKKALQNDFKGTLKALSDMGYDGVEFCGNYGEMTGQELSEYLDYLGLTAVSAHVPVDDILDDEKFKMHADILSKCGCMYMAHGWIDPEKTDLDEFAEKLEAATEKCAMNGFVYCYHTHGKEFEIKDSDGVSYFDNLMEKADLCMPEFDVFWMKHAGVDIEQYLRRYAGKINLLHVKQMKDDESKEITSLDNGIIDFAPIVKTAKKFGTECFIYEQDYPTTDELSDAKSSIEYFRTLK